MLGQGKQHGNTAALPCQHGSHQKWENATASVERDPTALRKGSLCSSYQGCLITVCISDELPVLESQNDERASSEIWFTRSLVNRQVTASVRRVANLRFLEIYRLKIRASQTKNNPPNPIPLFSLSRQHSCPHVPTLLQLLQQNLNPYFTWEADGGFPHSQAFVPPPSSQQIEH